MDPVSMRDAARRANRRGWHAMSEKTDLKAIIIPGLFFGTLYVDIWFTAMKYLEPAFPPELKYRFLFVPLLLIIAPAMLILTGTVSERLRIRDGYTDWNPWSSYMAGVVGGITAGFLHVAGLWVNHYTPNGGPDIAVLIVWEIGIMPFLLIPIVIFAACAYTGGFFTYWISRRREQF